MPMKSAQSRLTCVNIVAFGISLISIISCILLLVAIQRECTEMEHFLSKEMNTFETDSTEIWKLLENFNTNNPERARKRRQISQAFFSAFAKRRSKKYRGYPAVPIVLGAPIARRKTPIAVVVEEKTKPIVVARRSNENAGEYQSINQEVVPASDVDEYADERNVFSEEDAASTVAPDTVDASTVNGTVTSTVPATTETVGYGSEEQEEKENDEEIPKPRPFAVSNQNYPPPNPKPRTSDYAPPSGPSYNTYNPPAPKPQPKPKQPKCDCKPPTSNTCPPGPPGPPGQRGQDGEAGDNGDNGKDGEQAEDVTVQSSPTSGCVTCPAGPTGPSGLPGKKGMRGMRGARGTTGFPGHNGQPGIPGTSGVDGPNGPDGEVGPPGTHGKDGTAGVGAPGDKGVRGPPGALGEPGEPGDTGVIGVIGVEGPLGDQGHPGQDGQQGELGEMGEEGEPGYDAEYCPCPRRVVTKAKLLRQLV